MDDRPSFRRRYDVLQLLVTIFVPWLLAAIAFAPVPVYWVLDFAGWQNEWFTFAVALWYWVGCLVAVLATGGMCLFASCRMLRSSAYRDSVYGWSWFLGLIANIAALGAALGD